MGFGRGYVLRKWRVLTPRTAPGVLAREGVLLAGQAVIDRNLSGLGARVAGWRAATPGERFPAAVLERGGGDSLGATLRRRLRRRLRRGARAEIRGRPALSAVALPPPARRRAWRRSPRR